METIEFLCYIASILSLWFGFSIVSLDDWFNKIFSWLKKLTASQIIHKGFRASNVLNFNQNNNTLFNLF